MTAPSFDALASVRACIHESAPPTGRRDTLVEALAHLFLHTSARPVTLCEVGTSRKRHRTIEDGHATKALAWYAQDHGGELVAIDTDPLAISCARRLVPAGKHFRLIHGNAEEYLGQFDAIDLLYLDGPSESVTHGRMWDALTCRPLFVLIDDIFGPGDAVPGGDPTGAHAKHVANWKALEATAPQWAVKGEIVIPKALANGYEIVFHRDRQVLLRDTRSTFYTNAPYHDGTGAARVVQRQAPPRVRRPIPQRPTLPRERHLGNHREIPSAPVERPPLPRIPDDFRAPGPVDPSIALIIGGGGSVWDDLGELYRTFGPWRGLVIAVNDVGCHLPFAVDHWVTLHAEKIDAWTKARRANGHPAAGATWTRKGARSKQVTHVVTPWGGGASGLLAVAVAHHLKAERAVLCGVPMTRTPHFAQSAVHNAAVAWKGSDSHYRAWTANAHRLTPWVRSFSGRTRELLGAPDAAFIGVAPAVPSSLEPQSHDDTDPAF
jgi:hypothetical protein